MSYNGTPLTVKEFKDFCKAFLIVHITTALYHPRSNGQAERFVDTFKRELIRYDIVQFLRVYLVTPVPRCNSGFSPASTTKIVYINRRSGFLPRPLLLTTQQPSNKGAKPIELSKTYIILDDLNSLICLSNTSSPPHAGCTYLSDDF